MTCPHCQAAHALNLALARQLLACKEILEQLALKQPDWSIIREAVERMGEYSQSQVSPVASK